MVSIILCLLCIAAVALWIVYSIVCGVRSLLASGFSLIVVSACALLGFGILYLVLHFLIIVFTDFSIIGNAVAAFYEAIGGFWGTLLIVIGIGLVGRIVAFFAPGFSLIGSVIFHAATAVAAGIYMAIEWIEERLEGGYNAVVAQIAIRVGQIREDSE